MVSVRCPGCGAKTKDGSVKCRICGTDLRGQTERPLTQPKPGSAQMRSGGLGGLFALAVLGVLGIVLAGVLLGVLPGGGVITTVRNKVPFLASQADDGWEEFTEPSARFRATLPVDRTQQEAPLAASTTGTAEEWVSTLGPEDDPDTVLSIQWATVPAPDGEDVQATTTSAALGWAEAMGGKVVRDDETSFQGFPARIVTVEGLETPSGTDVTVKAVLIRRRDQLFILESSSIYPDHPQFSRLVNGFALL
jgi:hypothetical protein